MNILRIYLKNNGGAVFLSEGLQKQRFPPLSSPMVLLFYPKILTGC